MTAFADFLLELGPGARTPTRPRSPDQRRRTVSGDGWRLHLDEGSAAPPIREAAAGGARLWIIGEADADPAALLADVLAEREQPADLGGHWLLLCIDAARDRVSLWTDRLGTYHAYYTTGSSGATGASGVLLSMRFSGPGDENFFISPSGLPFTQGAASGSTVFSVTAINGTTATTADNNSQHGFLVIGA